MDSPYKYFLIFLFATMVVVAGVYYFANTKTLVAPTTTTRTTNSPGPTLAACKSSDLTATLTNGNGAAGSYNYTLDIKNAGPASCNYSGSTTISLLDSQNSVVGSTTATVSVIQIIAAGGSINSGISFPDSGNFTGANACKPGVTTLAVYPPSQTVAVTVANIDQLQPGFTDHYCSGFTVQTFQPVPHPNG